MAKLTYPTIRVHDQETDEIVDREMTAEEWDQWQVVQVENDARRAEVEAKIAARSSALAKLAALGLTEEDLAAL